MLSGEPYFSADPDLLADRARAAVALGNFNAPETQAAERGGILRALLGAVGEGTVIMPRFTCDYGFAIRIGRGGFINYDCIFLDCAPIEIGDFVQMGPAVQLYAALHPLDPDERRSGIESARPIRIGHDVWIGGGAIVLPGVSVGDAAVIGAGSVVTRDVEARTVVAGNPARVVRTIR